MLFRLLPLLIIFFSSCFSFCLFMSCSLVQCCRWGNEIVPIQYSFIRVLWIFRVHWHSTNEVYIILHSCSLFKTLLVLNLLNFVKFNMRFAPLSVDWETNDTWNNNGSLRNSRKLHFCLCRSLTVLLDWIKGKKCVNRMWSYSDQIYLIFSKCKSFFS